jgi:hypothetical protein
MKRSKTIGLGACLRFGPCASFGERPSLNAALLPIALANDIFSAK